MGSGFYTHPRQEQNDGRNNQKNDRLPRHGIHLARSTEQRTDARSPHAASGCRLRLLQPQAVRKIRRQSSESDSMIHCYYCRDAATTTAGDRNVCDDCRRIWDIVQDSKLDKIRNDRPQRQHRPQVNEIDAAYLLMLLAKQNGGELRISDSSFMFASNLDTVEVWRDERNRSIVIEHKQIGNRP